MIETVIVMLIYLCILALVLYLVTYVVGVLGIPIPPKVVQIILLIIGLLVVLWLVQTFIGGGLHLHALK